MRTKILLVSIATAAFLSNGPASAALRAGADAPQAQSPKHGVVLAQARFGGGGGRAAVGGGAPRFSGGGGGGARFSGAPARFYGGGRAGVRWAGQPRRWGERPYYRYGRWWGPGWGWGYGVGWGLGVGYPYYAVAPYYYYDAPAYTDAEAYCASRFKSYDPASGTYLGYDGKRHPCP